MAHGNSAKWSQFTPSKIEVLIL